jgi:hypothetical protein
MFQSKATLSSALVAAIFVASLPLHAQDTPAPAGTTATPPPAAATPATGAAPPGETPAPVVTSPTPVDPAIPAVATGTLSLSSNPSGQIFIDGKDTGKTTPVEDLVVPAGKHELKIVDPVTKREATSEFTMDAGGTLSLNINLPETKAETAGTETTDGTKAADATPASEAPAANASNWTWMTLAGWTGLGLGTIGLLAGAVVLTSETEQADRQALGFGLFGTGAGLVLGGGVLLYLDDELADAAAAGQGAPSTANSSN